MDRLSWLAPADTATSAGVSHEQPENALDDDNLKRISFHPSLLSCRFSSSRCRLDCGLVFFRRDLFHLG